MNHPPSSLLIDRSTTALFSPFPFHEIKHKNADTNQTNRTERQGAGAASARARAWRWPVRFGATRGRRCAPWTCASTSESSVASASSPRRGLQGAAATGAAQRHGGGPATRARLPRPAVLRVRACLAREAARHDRQPPSSPLALSLRLRPARPGRPRLAGSRRRRRRRRRRPRHFDIKNNHGSSAASGAAAAL